MITQNTKVQTIRRKINEDHQTIKELNEIIKQLSSRILDNKKILENICDHQWKITRSRYDDHSLKSCYICGIEKY